MAEKQVVFQINISDNAEVKLANISASAEKTKNKFGKLGDVAWRVNNIYQLVVGTMQKVASAVGGLATAYNAHQFPFMLIFYFFGGLKYFS
ncbi:MAG: hypothetical protein IK032_02335 [Bacteroidales bacterium]|nr:hypothetical protein [Bacteroidales bacterium]